MTPQTLQNVSSASWNWDELRRFCFVQALRVVGSPTEADEAAQEAIVRAWRHRDRCRQPDRPFGWLGRIAHNEALRLAARRPREVPVEEPFATTTSSAADERLETRLLVDEVLDSLSDEDRELARLRYYEDLTCASLADHFGLSEGTVRVRLHRLRRRLRDRLEDQT